MITLRREISRRTVPIAGIVLVAALIAATGASAQPLIPPTAKLTASPDPVQLRETAVFDGSGSTGDGRGSTVASYEWDLDGDGVFELDTGTVPTASRSYDDPGTVTVRLLVTDSEGDVAEASESIRVNHEPVGGFIYEPSPAKVNRRVTFSSTARDRDGTIADSAHVWEFDGDGNFDDAVGETVTVSFARAGTKVISLRVTDSDGATATTTRLVRVDESKPKLLSPFPIVQLAGELTSGGSTQIKRLSVRAPSDSDVTVRCQGKSCPFDKKERTIKHRRVNFPEIRGVLRPGVVIEVFVTKPGKVGKFTRFKLRDGQVPKRRDRCLAPGSRQPIDCRP